MLEPRSTCFTISLFFTMSGALVMMLGTSGDETRYARRACEQGLFRIRRHEGVRRCRSAQHVQGAQHGTTIGFFVAWHQRSMEAVTALSGWESRRISLHGAGQLYPVLQSCQIRRADRTTVGTPRAPGAWQAAQAQVRQSRQSPCNKRPVPGCGAQ